MLCDSHTARHAARGDGGGGCNYDGTMTITGATVIANNNVSGQYSDTTNSHRSIVFNSKP